MKLESLEKASLKDIMTRDLQCYKPGKEQELLDFLKPFHFSFVPNENRDGIFKIEGNQFVKTELKSNMTCAPTDPLFASSTLDKFKNGHSHDEVLFVMSHGAIQGVVHVADYNKDFVAIEIFKAIRELEKYLRHHLHLKNLTNDDLLNWIKAKATNDNYWKGKLEDHIPQNYKKREEKEYKRINLPPFQTFYLKTLIDYSRELEVINLSAKEAKHLTELRNWVSHTQDATYIDETSTSIFEIKELENIFQGIAALRILMVQFDFELSKMPIQQK